MVRGKTWFPLAQIGAFLAMLMYGLRRQPPRPMHQRIILAGTTSSIMLGSEWAHNLAHLVGAHLLGKPMDELHIIFGMPRCIYFELDDTGVTPRQHIQRSLAGPLFNAGMLPLLVRLRQDSTPGSMARELWDAALGMNIFLATASLLPIPGIDGGPVLKWTLVERGHPPEEADEFVRQVNGPLALILGLGGVLAYLRHKRLLGLLLAALAGTALGVFKGWIRETEMLQGAGGRK